MYHKKNVGSPRGAPNFYLLRGAKCLNTTLGRGTELG